MPYKSTPGTEDDETFYSAYERRKEYLRQYNQPYYNRQKQSRKFFGNPDGLRKLYSDNAHKIHAIRRAKRIDSQDIQQQCIS